ncbi:hypothetical protein ASG90_05700 [Nocardioides sp. Soil797]|nr:hypothetical protein ASG90_05700 [Nocardioides sp. Soil797]
MKHAETGGSAVRNNPHAGPQELKLKQALETNYVDLVDTESAWQNGADELLDLSAKLVKQKERVELDYPATGGPIDPGGAAALTYERLIKSVDKRRLEMTEVAAAVGDADKAMIAALQDYNALPPVSDPSTGDPTAGIVGHGKKAINKRTEALKAAQKVDDKHAADVALAESKAREALGRLDSAIEKATDKMRPVAGLEKPGSVTNPGTAADVRPVSAGPTKTTPGVISQTQIEQTQTTTQTPHVVNTGQQTPVIHQTPLPTNEQPTHNTGLLQSSSPPVVNSNPPVSIGANPTPTSSAPVSASPVVTPGLSTSAISRTATPLPGTTQARSTALGRSSSSTASRGVLGRNSMMPGQSAAGRTAAAGRGTRGMMPGQSGTKGSRGTAGSRGARGTGGRGMAPGTGGTRGKGKNRDRDGDSVDLLWDDGQDWLGDDETSPEVLS